MARRATAALGVFLNGRKVGVFTRQSTAAVDFVYDRDWLAWPSTFPISLSLPLREQRYAGDPVLAVFDNLLPDEIPRSAGPSRPGSTRRATTPLAC
jgi:serine/threonine-protein kinase HipA